MVTGLAQRRAHQSAALPTMALQNPTFAPQAPSIVRPNDCDHITDGIFIGSEASARNGASLASLGITHIVNMNGNGYAPGFPAGFEYYYVKLRDSGFDTLNEDFWGALKWTLEAIGSGHSVLIHCKRGICRSAALAVACLMETKKWTFDTAYAFVKEKRPAVSIEQGFADQIREKEVVVRPVDGGRPRFLPNLRL
jgi:atypical dual specificity phosphatase